MTTTAATTTAAATGERGLRIAELARAVQVSTDTVRYYERIGLLPPPRRTAGGYRDYDAGAVDRLRFIQGAQRLGLHLVDIGHLLAVRDTGDCPCEPAGELLPVASTTSTRRSPGSAHCAPRWPPWPRPSRPPSVRHPAQGAGALPPRSGREAIAHVHDDLRLRSGLHRRVLRQRLLLIRRLHRR